ncbi:MAG: chemotaxis protein CheV [Fibrobacterota bacterium]
MLKSEQDRILLESGTNEVEFLVVDVAGQLFGINVAKVKSIQQYKEERITPIPDSHDAVMGMWRDRRETITLIDLAKALGKEITEDYDREIVIVTEFNSVVNSFRVQGVKRIYRVSWDDFTPVSEFTAINSHITGSVFIDETEIMILDLEQIISRIFPDMVSEEIEERTIEHTDESVRNSHFILFAEDSKLIRTNVHDQLARSGFENIKSFDNGRDLFEYLTAEFETIKKSGLAPIILTDIEMPQMDGLTLTKKVRDHYTAEHIPVIVFSSLINDQMIEKCKSVGADRAISKPSFNELIETVDDFCN